MFNKDALRRKRMLKRMISVLISISFVALFASVALAKYPARRITLIHTWKAGMPAHVAAQMLAENMGKALGKKVIINIVTGGGGVKAVKQFLTKPADGYTLLNIYGGTAAAVPMVQPDVGYDSIRDFIPIGGPINGVETIAVRKDETRFRTLPELLAYAKKNPGLKYGAGRQTLPHMDMVILFKKLDIKFKMIPYPGSVPAMKDLLGGTLDFAIPNGGGYLTYKEDIHPLATVSNKQTGLVPHAPAIKALYDTPIAEGWNYWVVKKGTPKHIVKTLQAAMAKSFKVKGYGKRLNEIGWGFAARTPQEFAPLIKSTQAVLKEGVAAAKWEENLKW